MARDFAPTYLYIKQHSLTGLLYFGKTTRAAKLLNEQYVGSGHYWNRHLSKHGKEHITTLWFCLFTNPDELKKFALQCSILWNIVGATENGKKVWANEKLENGLDGGFDAIWAGKTQSESHKRKRLDKLLGSHRPDEVKQKVSETRIRKHADGTLVTKKGSKLTDAQKEVLSNIAKDRPLLTCSTCRKSCTAGNFSRWHGANCKPRNRSTLKENI